MIRVKAFKGKKKLKKSKLKSIKCKNQFLRYRDIDLEIKMENEVGNHFIPKGMVENFHFNANAKIYFRKPTEKRQGSAEHIIADHKPEINYLYIMAMRASILDPIDIIEMKRNRLGLVSYYLKDKQNRNVFFYVIVENVMDGFEIITAFPTRKYKRQNKKDDVPREPI